MMLSCDWRLIRRMAQRLLRKRFLFRIIVFVSLLSFAAVIRFVLLSELTFPLLPRSDEKRSSKKLQDYPTAPTKSVFIPHASKSTGFNSLHYNSAVFNEPSDTSKASEVGKKRYRNLTELMKRSREYCNSLKHSTYIEGSVPTTYKLSAVAVIFRHGERTLLNRFLNSRLSKKLSCNYSDFIGNQTFSLRSLVRSSGKNKNGMFSMNPQWQNFNPNSHACSSRLLTSQGFMQMVQLGEYFRDVYFNDKYFAQSVLNTSAKIYVRTTAHGQAIESAYGFLLGLLQNKDGLLPNIDFEKVKFTFNDDIYFCSNSVGKFSCNCSAVDRLARMVEQEHQQILAITRVQEQEIKAALATIFNVSASHIPWMGSMLEALLSHVCLGQKLPCRLNSKAKSHCVTWPLINKMWDFVDNYYEQNMNSSAEESFSTLASYPLLHDIVHHFLNVTNYSTHKNSSRLFIFSGHDKTIEAIMKALRIHNGHWTPYAAQVTFELYSQRNKQYYIRVLYNGKDLTKRVRFCNSSHNFCPFENFVYFIVYEVNRHLKVKNYSEVCQYN